MGFGVQPPLENDAGTSVVLALDLTEVAVVSEGACMKSNARTTDAPTSCSRGGHVPKHTDIVFAIAPLCSPQQVECCNIG